MNLDEELGFASGIEHHRLSVVVLAIDTYSYYDFPLNPLFRRQLQPHLQISQQ